MYQAKTTTKVTTLPCKNKDACVYAVIHHDEVMECAHWGPRLPPSTHASSKWGFFLSPNTAQEFMSEELAGGEPQENKNKYKRSLVWWKLSSHSNTKSRSETKSVQLEKGCGLRLWLTDSSSPWNKQPKLRCQLCLFISLSSVPHLKQQHSSPHSFYSRQECYCHSYICGLWVNVVIQITTVLAFY